MDQKRKEKLRMSNPEFYDATENRVAVVQEYGLLDLFRDGRAEGRSVAAFIGALTLTITTLLTLASVQTFGNEFGIPGSTWQAIFIIVAIASAVWTIAELLSIISRIWRKDFWSEDIIRAKFFSDNQKLDSRKPSTSSPKRKTMEEFMEEGRGRRMTEQNRKTK